MDTDAHRSGAKELNHIRVYLWLKKNQSIQKDAEKAPDQSAGFAFFKAANQAKFI